MLRLKGETAGEYFHVTCEQCGERVELANLRWVGGVPQLEASCGNCDESGDFKLDPQVWIDIVPEGS